MSSRGAAICASLTALVFLAACAEPPHKELDRAQGAIDAARAAGAEQYATTEYETATAALDSAHDAVAARDYRLALNYALESHEHAQNAARDTADTKARVRADVERTIAQIESLIAQAQERLGEAERLRVPGDTVADPAKELAAAAADLQEARAATTAGEYLKANARLEGLRTRVEGAATDLEAAITAQSARRRR